MTTRRLLHSGLILAVLLSGTCRPGSQSKVEVISHEIKSGSRSRVVLLGTGTPNADPEHSGPAVAIIFDDTAYVVDCGPGIVRRAAAAYKNGITALELSNLHFLFVTHLHSDHPVGLPDIMLTPWVLGRDAPLVVYGPVGIKNMMHPIQQAYEEDIRMRIDGLEHANTEGCKVNVHEIQPGEIYSDDRVIVQAFAVRHGSWKFAFGFRFDTPDRSIVISGDTTPCESLIENAKGCDTLIHEVYSFAGFQTRTAEWQRYHAASRTSTLELARIASEVKPRLLILYHQLYWGQGDKDLLREIHGDYQGAVVSGQDLGVY
ncbi:MAG: MBL fold metallo-hydrolase [Planctomycetes bacterium]|nr:MBL fold metallo-hydrolase [Planctomycetota bacterium]